MKKNIEKIDYSQYTENQQRSMEINADIIELCKIGKLHDHIVENAVELERDSGGKVTKVYFAQGGPTAFLDLYCNPGYVIFEFGFEERGMSGLPLSIKDEVISIVEEFDYAS